MINIHVQHHSNAERKNFIQNFNILYFVIPILCGLEGKTHFEAPKLNDMKEN